MRATLAMIVFAVAACSQPDACERALARVGRIGAARGWRPMSDEHAAQALDSCRHGKYAAFDPTLICAMDSATDRAAAACIDRFLSDVIKPGSGSSSGSGL